MLGRFFTVTPMPVTQSINEVTQWNNGLLAHDWLAGRYFKDLKMGDEISTMDSLGNIQAKFGKCILNSRE